MPMMKNQRAHIAVEVYSATLSTKCTASAAVFMVKSSRFTGDKCDVDWLHKDILRHRIIQNTKDFKFNINGLLLEMVVTFNDTNPTRISIELKNIREYIKYAPVFHRANAFA
jgi:hypothetical protein